MLRFLLPIFLVSSFYAHASLHGSYTIDPSKKASASNYTSFNDAADDLLKGVRSVGSANGPGVSAAVTFNIADGMYNERVTITSVKGASGKNSITFQSASGDSSKVILMDSTTGSPGFVLHLKNASHIRFNRITLKRGGNGNAYTYSDYVILIDSVSDSNTIANCVIRGLFTSGTNYYSALVYSGLSGGNYTTDEHDSFENNYLTHGYYGMMIEGNYSYGGQEGGNVIDHNTMDTLGNYGIYGSYQYGLIITNNKIDMSFGNYGIYLQETNQYNSTPVSRILNNFISVGKNVTGGTYNAGLYFSTTDHTNIAGNNINIYGSATYSYGAYLYMASASTALNIYNNIFYNQNKGSYDYALYANYLTTEDYDNIICPSKSPIYYAGSSYSSLKNWQSSGKGFAKHDVSVNPYYTSNTDLHINSFKLDGVAKPLSYDTLDIDNELRDAKTPDIGADEITVPKINPSIIALTSPTGTFCSGSKSVQVTLANYGSDTLKSVNIEWSVNRKVQTTYQWTGVLYPLSSTSVTLGSYTFAGVDSLYIYADTANGSAVVSTSKNTTRATVLAAMSGIYTIDSSKAVSPDYKNFPDAMLDLNHRGICGATTFNIGNGTYYAHSEIDSIPGISAKNTVTIQSASKDSSKVILMDSTSGSLGADAYVIRLNKAKYLNFNELTFIRKSGSPIGIYNHVVELQDASYNLFSNCRFIGADSSASVYGGALVYAGLPANKYGGNSSSNNVFKNNYLKKGYYGFCFHAMTSIEVNNIFTRNILDSTFYAAIYLNYNTADRIIANTINMKFGNYGIYEENGDQSSNTYGVIENNFIPCDSNNISKRSVPIFILYSMYTHVRYNNVNIFGPSLDSTSCVTVINFGPAAGVYMYSNNLINANSGSNDYALYYEGLSSESNNNLMSGGMLTYANGFFYPTLAGYNTYNSAMAINDISTNPKYTSNTDLHILNPGLRHAKGMTLDSTDYDGDRRNIGFPCLGADEIKTRPIDPSIFSLISPAVPFCKGTQNITVTLANFGTQTLTKVKIGWSVNGVSQTPYYWKGTLKSGSSANIAIGSFTFSNIIKPYTLVILPDSANDSAIVSTAGNTITINTGIGLSGSYSIDNSGLGSPDYTSFRNAVADFELKGLCGAVTFNVADGDYIESPYISAVTGSSSKNTITFQSKSGDSSKVILDTSNALSIYVTGNCWTLHLDGVSNIAFRKMSIVNNGTYGLGSYYDYPVYLSSTNNNLSFENCIIKSKVDKLNFGNNIGGISPAVNHLNIKNSHITGSNFGLICLGTGFNFYHNVVDSFNDIGLYVSGDSTDIAGNIITGNSAGAYGPYPPAGMYLGGTTTSNVNNNMITELYPSGFGIYGIAYHMHFNSIVSNSSNNYYSTVYDYGADMTDNIFINIGGGVVLSTSGGTGSPSPDHNDIYTTGKYIGCINSPTLGPTYYATPADWQKATTWDKHSIDVDPHFASISTGNLHLSRSSFGVLQQGIPIASIKNDIDGDVRAKKPDLGADEVKKYKDDAGVFSIDSPEIGFCSATQNVYVRLCNYGLDSLKSATVSWSVNGTYMGSYSWSGKLASHTFTQIKLGAYSFTSSKNVVKSWTSLPNGVTDSSATNDTTSRWVGMGLSGTYLIDTAIKGYSFRLAANDLADYGVCGPVIFKAADGSYNQSMAIHHVNGSSPVNTITFESSSLDSSLVKIDTSWAGQRGGFAYTVLLDSASYITLRKLTISNSASFIGTTAEVLFMNGANHNTISNNILTQNTWSLSGVVAVSNALVAAAVSNDDNSSESYNTISNNYINGGVEGIHFNAPASEKGNIIKGNTFYLTKRYGILASFQDSLLVENNNVQMPLCEYGNGINVNNGLNADTSYIINNFVSISGTMGVGLYSYDNTLINIYNNSIEGDVTSGSLSPAWTAYIYSSKAGNSHVYNNVFYNGAGEMAIVGNSNAITSSDYNDIASTGSFLTYWNGAYYNTLSAWQKAAGKDAHSLSADPAFYDFSMGDLHLTDSSHALFTAALYLSDVPKDIDGQQRHKKPSIGADEYVPLDSNDVGVSTLILPANNSCGSDSTIISLRIKNHGASDQTNSFNVHLDFTGISISPIVIPIKGTLKAGKDSLISIYMNTSKGGKFSVKSYTDLKNDSVHGNDTAFASINFYSLPDASFKFISMGGGLIDFTPSDSTLKSYNWNFGDASANGITKKPSHTYSNGRYQVSLTTKNNNSCTATWSDSLIINFTGLASVNVNLNTLDISPNPFSNSTTISYTLAKTENVKIEVYNMLGVHLYTLIDTRQTEGTYSIKFSLEQNRNLSSGIYLIKITRDGAAEQKQAIMTR